MKFITDTKRGILGKPDPVDLWEKLISYIPDEKLLDNQANILCCACGHGTEADVLVRRMLALGVDSEDIKKRIFLLDKYKVFTNEALRKKYTQVIKADFLEWKTDMKFDVIVSNPPYLRGTWFKFLEKSLSLSPEYLIQISPDGVGSLSPRSEKIEKTLLDNGLQQYVDCTESFPTVESGRIIYAVLEPGKPSKSGILEDNSVAGKLVKKIINFKGNKIQARLSSKRSTEHVKAERYDTAAPGRIKNLESVTKAGLVFKFIDQEHTMVVDGNDYWFTNRYVGKGGEATIFECNETIGISHNIMIIEKIKGMSIDQFKKILLQPVKISVLDYMRGGGFDTSPRHLRQISLVDDKQYKLTPEEKEYVYN